MPALEQQLDKQAGGCMPGCMPTLEQQRGRTQLTRQRPIIPLTHAQVDELEGTLLGLLFHLHALLRQSASAKFTQGSTIGQLPSCLQFSSGCLPGRGSAAAPPAATCGPRQVCWA